MQETKRHLRFPGRFTTDFILRTRPRKALGQLKKAGIIEIKRKEIQILHRPRSERAARE
jgi:hypothetical protein